MLFESLTKKTARAIMFSQIIIIVIHHQNIVFSMIYVITNFKMKMGVQKHRIMEVIYIPTRDVLSL